MNRLLPLLLGLLGGAAPVLATAAPDFGRYMPLYPGRYLTLSYSADAGDAVFDANGDRVDGNALPTLDGQSRLPRNELRGAMSWHFPFFETYELPFISSRTWVARVAWGHASTRAEGAIADFAADTSDDAATEADNLGNDGGGIGDLSFEMGTYLFGSPTADWRSREGSPLALLATAGLTVNVGEYERNAPVSAGDNTPSMHVALGLHAQPWSGGFIDAGARLRAYVKNQDPAFGAMAPAQAGDTIFWDISLAQRLFAGAYLTIFAEGFDRAANRYSDTRFAFDPPLAPPGSDARATPGDYFDEGVQRTTIGAAFEYFLTQRWSLGLRYSKPVSGRSGRFDLPFDARVPSGCFVDAVGCTLVPIGSAAVDGLGLGRALASDQIALTLRFQFLQRDNFNCRGCSR